MTKVAAISVRVTEETKRATEQAAQEEGRSMASYVARLLTEHLNAKGYLPQAKP